MFRLDAPCSLPLSLSVFCSHAVPWISNNQSTHEKICTNPNAKSKSINRPTRQGRTPEDWTQINQTSFFPLCVLAQHKIYFKLFSNCWLKPRVSCLVCCATQWGRQPGRHWGRRKKVTTTATMGRNKPRQKTTNTSLFKASTLFRVSVCVCVWQIRKMLPPTSWYFIQFMQMRQEREIERLLCSVHSYQQISKRPSSQRLIIPPLSLSMNANWIWQNHEKFEIRILFVAFFALVSFVNATFCSLLTEYD